MFVLIAIYIYSTGSSCWPFVLISMSPCMLYYVHYQYIICCICINFQTLSMCTRYTIIPCSYGIHASRCLSKPSQTGLKLISTSGKWPVSWGWMFNPQGLQGSPGSLPELVYCEMNINLAAMIILDATHFRLLAPVIPAVPNRCGKQILLSCMGPLNPMWSVLRF